MQQPFKNFKVLIVKHDEHSKKAMRGRSLLHLRSLLFGQLQVHFLIFLIHGN